MSLANESRIGSSTKLATQMHAKLGLDNAHVRQGRAQSAWITSIGLDNVHVRQGRSCATGIRLFLKLYSTTYKTIHSIT